MNYELASYRNLANAKLQKLKPNSCQKPAARGQKLKAHPTLKLRLTMQRLTTKDQRLTPKDPNYASFLNQDLQFPSGLTGPLNNWQPLQPLA